MFNKERRQYILKRLQEDGRVIATDLSRELNVSEDTIRRDLRDMAAEGLIQRVHGGALPRSPAAAKYTSRQLQSPAAKARIAQVAASLVQKGQIIVLDGGTTNLLVAQYLPANLQATVITNSPPVAVTLMEHAHMEVILLGGRLFKHSVVTVGAVALEAMRLIRADLYMLGVNSLHPESGISDLDIEETHLKRLMIENSAEVAALVSPEKFGTAAPYTVAPISELTYLITEQSVSEAVLVPYQDQGIKILRA